MKQYKISKQSIKEANPHIANIASLVAGMKVKITSQAKVLRHPLPKPIKQAKLKEQKIKVANIRHPHVYNRPFNNSIIYDQKWNTFQFEVVSSSDFSAFNIQERCQHCHKPHYYVTY